MQQEYRIRELYEVHHGKHHAVLEAVARDFNWPEEMAYIATEFLFRPENTN